MKLSRIILLAALLLLLLSCRRGEITREEWQQMTVADRDLVVQSFIGGEDAADAKGGGGQAYSKPPAFYREEIDRRYRQGDTRSVNEIWEELSDR